MLLSTGSRAVVLLSPGETLVSRHFTPRLEGLDWVGHERMEKGVKLTAGEDPLLLAAETPLYHRYSGKLRGVGNVFFVRKARVQEKGQTAALISFAFTLDFSPTLVKHLANNRDLYTQLEVWRKIRAVLLYDDEVAVCRKGSEEVWVLTRPEYEEALRSI